VKLSHIKRAAQQLVRVAMMSKICASYFPARPTSATGSTTLSIP